VTVSSELVRYLAGGGGAVTVCEYAAHMISLEMRLRFSRYVVDQAVKQGQPLDPAEIIEAATSTPDSRRAPARVANRRLCLLCPACRRGYGRGVKGEDILELVVRALCAGRAQYTGKPGDRPSRDEVLFAERLAARGFPSSITYSGTDPRGEPPQLVISRQAFLCTLFTLILFAVPALAFAEGASSDVQTFIWGYDTLIGAFVAAYMFSNRGKRK
jgi:hypothetical protein